MRDFLINNNIINCARHGRSTCTNLLECLNDWTLYIQDRQQVIVAYIDFSKAFDVESHSKLFARLQSYGIKGTLLSWLKIFLIAHGVLRLVLCCPTQPC